MLLPLSDLFDLVMQLGGEIKFTDPCIVKLTPHSAPTKIYSIDISGGIIYINETVILHNPNNIVNSLIQRCKYELVRRRKQGKD